MTRYNGVLGMTYLSKMNMNMTKVEHTLIEGYISRTPYILTMLSLIIISEICLFIGIFWGYYAHRWTNIITEGVIYPSNTDLVIYITLSLIILSVLGIKKLEKIEYIEKLRIVSGIFCILQVMEYNNNSLFINDDQIGSYFYLVTGLHFSHVVVGLLLISYMNNVNSKIYNIRSNINEYIKSLKVEMTQSIDFAIVYLHFVELLWILIFFSFYTY